MKHWRKEGKVIPTDQLEYRLVRREEFLELTCYFDSGESATQNQYLWPHCGIPFDPSIFAVVCECHAYSNASF